jgi:hypothetical protein
MGLRRHPLSRGALLVGGAYAVHQLRFLLAYGHDAGRVFGEPGHRYLPFAAAATAVLLLLATLRFAQAVARPSHPQPRRVALRRLWTENAVALVAIYVGQEGLEGAFTPGHPVWEHGGWIVLPLAVLFGGLIAVLLVGADRVLIEASRRAAAVPESKRLPVALPPGSRVVAVRLNVVARHLAGRAPPRADSPLSVRAAGLSA